MRPTRSLVLSFVVAMSCAADAATALAAPRNAPPAFDYAGARAVFVDFEHARYELRFDAAAETARYAARIEFSQDDAGYPLFDLVQDPETAAIDGQAVATTVIESPGGVTRYRTLAAPTLAGRHVLEITGRVAETRFSAEWDGSGRRYAGIVDFETWQDDLSDRAYLERWLPSNLDFDRFAIDLDVTVSGSESEHRVFANGAVARVAANHFTVAFAATSHASSIYFHVLPSALARGTNREDGALPLRLGETEFVSMTGRRVPVLIYSDLGGIDLGPTRGLGGAGEINRFRDMRAAVLDQLRVLESEYGPYLHDQLIVRVTKTGGMEYAGAATAGSVATLRHELTHSWIARGLTFADGGSAWLDEAITSWRDAGYPVRLAAPTASSCLIPRSPYQRMTNDTAYGPGAYLMGYLDGLLAARGGLRPLVAQLIREQAFVPISMGDFIVALNAYAGTDLGPVFDRWARCP